MRRSDKLHHKIDGEHNTNKGVTHPQNELRLGIKRKENVDQYSDDDIQAEEQQEEFPRRSLLVSIGGRMVLGGIQTVSHDLVAL